MYFKEEDSFQDLRAVNFSLTEAILQTSSSLFSISNLHIDQFKNEQDDVFYYQFNNFNDFLEALRKSSDYYQLEIEAFLGSKNEDATIVFYIAISCLLVCFATMIPVVLSVTKTKRKFLEIFLEIDNSNIRKLANKCEKFMNAMTDETNEELESNEDEIDDFQRDEEDFLLQKRSKKKKAKETMKNRSQFLIKFFVGICCIMTYYFANYYVEILFREKAIKVVEELQNTAAIEPFFWFSLNAQRELLNSPERPVLGGDSFEVSNDAIQRIYELNSQMQSHHLTNRESYYKSYRELFQSRMIDDLC